jgi:uncharacterized membrane protein YedE/YeeE
MTTHPSITYELVALRQDEFRDRFAPARCATSRHRGAAIVAQRRSPLAIVGSLLIAAGERLGGIHSSGTGRLTGAAR